MNTLKNTTNNMHVQWGFRWFFIGIVASVLLVPSVVFGVTYTETPGAFDWTFPKKTALEYHVGKNTNPVLGFKVQAKLGKKHQLSPIGISMNLHTLDCTNCASDPVYDGTGTINNFSPIPLTVNESGEIEVGLLPEKMLEKYKTTINTSFDEKKDSLKLTMNFEAKASEFHIAGGLTRHDIQEKKGVFIEIFGKGYVAPSSTPAKAAAGTCKCKNVNDPANKTKLQTFDFIKTQAACIPKEYTVHPTDLTKGALKLEDCAWTATKTTGSTGASNSSANKGPQKPYDVNLADYAPPAPGTYNGPLPPCAFNGSCRNVNDLLEVFINFGEMILGIIGSFALVFFVYGGFMMIISMGNAERVKKGRDILVAAVTGIIIAFSGYALVSFMLNALNVSDEFRLIGNTSGGPTAQVDSSTENKSLQAADNTAKKAPAGSSESGSTGETSESGSTGSGTGGICDCSLVISGGMCNMDASKPFSIGTSIDTARLVKDMLSCSFLVTPFINGAVKSAIADGSLKASYTLDAATCASVNYSGEQQGHKYSASCKVRSQ